MKWWLVLGLLCSAAVMLCAFTLQNFGLSVNPAALPQITGISVSPSTFSVPSGGTAPFSGTLTAQCSVSPCPGAASFAIGATISVNNSTTGTTVSPAASMTVAVSGGPGNPGDWMGICNVGTPTYSACDGAGFFWTWVDNCTMTGAPPSAGISANTCTLTAPVANGSYAAYFLNNDTYTPLTSAPFTVTGAATPAITAVFVTPSTILNGQTLSGSLIAQCSGNDPCPGLPNYSLSTTNPCGGQTNSNGLFNLSGSTLSSSAAMSTNGTYYACVSVAMGGVSNTNAILPVKVTVTAGGALAGSTLPACPRSCTWVNAYNSDFTTETSFDYTYSAVDASHEWFVPRDGMGAGGSPGATNACSQMLDASTMPGYLSIHTTGTLGWEVPGALVCNAMQIKGGAAGTVPGLTDNCLPAGPWFQCIPATGPVYYEYKMVASPNMIAEELLYAGPFAANTSFAAYLMEARGDNTSITGDGLPMLWPNGNHGRIQGPYKGWINGDPNPHIVGFMLDPSAGYSGYWDGTLTYPDPTQCTLAPCAPDPDNCASGPGTCYSNNPTTPAMTFDFGITSCTTCSGFVPGTTKLYFVRVYMGVGGTGGGPPPTPAVTVNGTSSGATVAAGSNLTVVATNPPNNPTAWIGICDTATNPTGADCDTAGFNWTYLNCSPHTAPTAPVNSTPCTLVAPSPATNTSYYVNLFTANGYVVVASAPFTVTGTGQTGGGGTCTPAGSPCPVGVAAPSGTHWNLQFRDEFTQDSAVNTSQWNIIATVAGMVTVNSTNGLVLQPLLENPYVDQNIRAAVNSQTTTSFKPKLSHGTPPVGSVYIEYYTLYPHNNSGEGYGYHPDIWYRAYDNDGISFTDYEDDICEASLGEWPNNPTTLCQNGVGQGPPVVQYDCNCAVGDIPMLPAWHYYGFYWANDGSAHGSQTIYWDGAAYSGPYTLQAPYYDNGLIIIMSNDSCNTVYDTCNFNVITNNNPLSIQYVRVWQLVSG